jgi:hypothetical protein
MAWPVPLIRNLLPEADAVAMTVEVAAALLEAPLPEAPLPEAALAEAALAEPTAAFVPAVLLVPLLHAPANSAAASGTPSLTGIGTRAAHDFVTCVFSCPRRHRRCALSAWRPSPRMSDERPAVK